MDSTSSRESDSSHTKELPHRRRDRREALANPVYSGVIRPNGSVLRSVGVDAARTSRFGQGQYGVAFDQPVNSCAITTSASGSFAVPTTSFLGSDTLEIDWLDALTNKFVDTTFSVVVQC